MNASRHFRLSLFTLALVGFSGRASAALKLAALFSDHAVLQAGKALPVWGWADPGASVILSLGTARASAKADATGRFKATFAALKSGGPFELKAQSGAENVTAHDLVVGQVWVASGQSNMELSFNNTLEAKDDMPKADMPGLRFFVPDKGEGLAPMADVTGVWKVCGPANAGEFSAVAYQFGRRLNEALKMPVGMLVSSWGGTSIQLWTPAPSMAQVPFMARQLADWQSKPGEKKSLSSATWDFDLEFKDLVFVPKDPGKKPVPVLFKAGGWGGNWNANAQPGSTALFEAAESGHYHGKLKAFAWSGVTTSFLSSGKQDLSAYASVQLKVRGKGRFSVSLSQPSITDWDFYKGKPFEPSSEWQTLTMPLSEFKQDGWGAAKPFTPAEIGEISIACSPEWKGPEVPGGLYNAMIAPLAPYAISGYLWYQGEANVGNCNDYAAMLKAMVTGWRKDWNDASLPFLVVQLPNYIPKPESATGISWACLREAQAKACAELYKAGLIVSVGLGDPQDIHPKHKAEVGRRLFAAAMNLAYGKNDVVSGPRLKSAVLKSSDAMLTFDDLGGGFAPVSDLKGFELAGDDGIFQGALGSMSGSTVMLQSLKVPRPKFVRYAWSNDPPLSIFNKSGLPALPFKVELTR